MSVGEEELQPDEVLESRTGSRVPYTMVGDWVLLSDLSPMAKLLYALLFAHVNVTDETRKVWPSKETLAGWMGLKQPKSVGKYLDELIEFGAVRKVQQRTSGNMRTRNAYYVEGEPPPGLRTPIKFSEFYRQRNAAREQGVVSTGHDVGRPSAPRDDQVTPVSAGRDVGRPSAPRRAPERPAVGRPSAPEQDLQPQLDQGGEPEGAHEPAGEPAPDPTAPPPGNPEPVWKDPARWLCAAHRHLADAPGAERPPCGKCARVVEWARPRHAAWQRELLEERRRCPMCDAAGQRWDPVTHVAVSPLTSCDHDTPHATAVAELAEQEAAAEAARRAAAGPSEPVSSAEARAAARRLVASTCTGGKSTARPRRRATRTREPVPEPQEAAAP